MATPSTNDCHPERSVAQRCGVEGPAVVSSTAAVSNTLLAASNRPLLQNGLQSRKRRSLDLWFKSSQALLLAVAVCFSLGASSPTSRLNDLDHRLMCQCGCAQLLGECDHVGCPDRDKELADLSAGISSGLTDKDIFAAFTAKYGAVVLAAPTTHGFDLVAWIAPFAVFAAALLGTILLVRRWSGISIGRAQAAAAGADLAALDPAERERRERIRKDTGMDGEGY